MKCTVKYDKKVGKQISKQNLGLSNFPPNRANLINKTL